MKQNKIKVILFAAIGAILLLLLIFFAFSLLGSGGSLRHQHNFKEIVSFDAETHSLKCKCGKTQEAEHVYSAEYELQTEPTCSQKGTGLFTCQYCENTVVKELSMEVPHKYRNGVCSNCNYIETTDESFFDFTLLEDGTYSISVKDDVKDLPKNVKAVYTKPRERDSIQSRTRHVKPCLKARGPPRKAKYSLVTDSA